MACSNYTALNGLNFQSFCDYDLPCVAKNKTDCDIGSGIADTLQLCMERCSYHSPRCYGVAYRSDKQCYLKGNLVDASMLRSNNSLISAIADRNQLSNADTTCTSTTSVKGMQFTVQCNTDYRASGDYVPWSSGRRQHASTMDQCMGACADAHPLCLGIAWNADMQNGYENCYLKNSIGLNNTQAGVITHSAVVVVPQVNMTAPPTYSSGGIIFEINQFEGRLSATNFSSIHAENITSCTDNCAQDARCIGVSLDLSMAGGFSNCYLLNTTGSANKGANFTYAEITTPPSAQTGPWLNGVIAGTIVLALIIIAAGGYCLVRRLRRSTRGVGQHRRSLHNRHTGKPELSTEGPRHTMDNFKDGLAVKIHELPQENIQEMAPHDLYEMPQPRIHELPTHEVPVIYSRS